MHKELVATKEGAITGEEKLREKIAQLYGYIMFYKGKPTDSQMVRLNDLEKEVNVKNESLQKIKQTDLVKLNKSLAKAGKEKIKVITKEEYFKEK